MAHMIEKNDGLVLAEKRAWHNLGNVVEEAPTPYEAIKQAGLQWMVEESNGLSANFNGTTEPDYENGIKFDTHKLLIRSDDKSILGLVGRHYKPIQNDQLAYLAYELAGKYDKTSLKVETAGSLGGGKKVWFLLRAEPFRVTANDETIPYLFMANGHDGSQPLQIMPTDIRVVCANTRTYALNRAKKQGSIISLRHTLNIEKQIQDAKMLLSNGLHQLSEMRKQALRLAAKRLTKEDTQELWTNVYMKFYGPIPTDPYNPDGSPCGHKLARLERATHRLAEVTEIFDKEVTEHRLGRNAWTVANAFTNWLDKRKPLTTNSRSSMSQEDMRMSSNLFGTTAKQKRIVFEYADEMKV